MTQQPDPTQRLDLAQRLSALRKSVADAQAEAGRGEDRIVTIVVTKFQPASIVRELHALGVRDFGESRHQEAREKAVELADLDLAWHFVGQLQGKKARQVQRYARILHSVDRPSLVDALQGTETGVFVQVNLGDDPRRGGVAPRDLPALVDRVQGADGLRLAGVMAVAPLGADPRRAFATLHTLSEQVRAQEPTAVGISAGMSNDFREAVLEGATHLRIGTAITGKRPPPR